MNFMTIINVLIDAEIHLFFLISIDDGDTNL